MKNHCKDIKVYSNTLFISFLWAINASLVNYFLDSRDVNVLSILTLIFFIKFTLFYYENCFLSLFAFLRISCKDDLCSIDKFIHFLKSMFKAELNLVYSLGGAICEFIGLITEVSPTLETVP